MALSFAVEQRERGRVIHIMSSSYSQEESHSHVATNNLLLSKGEQSAKRLAYVSPA